MNRCPITYQECGDQKYSKEGLRLLSKSLIELEDFPYTAQEQLEQAVRYASKLSIQGVQPKLSARLDVGRKQFKLVANGGTFILKPPHPMFAELPQNEDLTMRLASSVGISVPLHGLIYSVDGSLTYFIKRYDRLARGKKLAVEDFAQLSERKRTTKYDSSMERLIPIIDAHCTFPMMEKIKLFRLTLFCFLVGNDDMHLKNFSLIRRPSLVELTPVYDLVNANIVLNSTEELALPLMGKKSKLSQKHLVDYFAKECLGLNSQIVEKEMHRFESAPTVWEPWIRKSFLSEPLQQKYFQLINDRWRKIY